MKAINRFKSAAILMVCASIILFSGCDTSTTSPDPPSFQGPILLVANLADGAGNLSVIELDSNKVTNGAIVEGNGPNDILAFEERIYVINSTSNDINVIRVLETSTLVLDTKIVLGTGNPMRGAVADNGYLYISNLVNNTVTVYDTRNSQLLSSLFVGTSPEGVKITNGKVYVCNSGFNADSAYSPGTVSTMLVGSNSFNVNDNISVGINPRYFDVDSEGRLHVVCTGNYREIAGRIYIINTNDDTVEQVFDIGGNPSEIAISSNGYAYIAAGGWSPDHQAGYVYRYAAATGEIWNGPDDPIEVGFGAVSVVADEDGAVYVSCQQANTVYKIVGDEVVDNYMVGTQPGSMLIYRR